MAKQTKAQLQAEIDMLRSNMVELAAYLKRQAAVRDSEFRNLEVERHAFARGMAGGTANGFSLAADWIIEELSEQR